MTVTIDSSILLAYYQNRAGIPTDAMALDGATTPGAPAKKPQPTAPWSASSTAPKASDLVKTALAGASPGGGADVDPQERA